MPSCPKCGKSNTDEAIYCTNCGVSLNGTSRPAASKSFQSETPISSSPSPATSPQIPSTISPGEPSRARLEKALRRAELLSYAAIGLSVLILIVALVLSFV